MNLYLSDGYIWTGTQKDAKAASLDGTFETREVPTDKPGLIAWLNAEWAKFIKQRVDEFVDAEEEEERGLHLDPAPTKPTDCPACNRAARVAKIVSNCEASMSIRADLEDVTDPRSLDSIIAAAQARKEELLGPS